MVTPPARRILILAFGILLALLLIAGWNAIATLSDIHTREQAARLDFLSRTGPLIRIHSKLVIYGTDGEAASQVFSQIRSELAQYPSARQPEEQVLVNRLLTMLDGEDHVQAKILTEQIAFWNDSQFRNANASLAAGFNDLRGRL